MFVKDFSKTAIVYGDETISYAKLIEMINRFSTLFDVTKGDRVAIFSENRPEWIYAYFSAWTKGATNVLIDMFASKDEVSYILQDCAPSVIFTSNRNITTIREAVSQTGIPAHVINLDLIETSPVSAATTDYSFTDNDTALLLYTSGTTGNSKGVMLSWKNIYTNINWNNRSKRININDTLLAVLPVHHSWPLMATILCPLECGATIVLLKNLNAGELIRTFRENKITMLTAVPRLFEMLHRGIMAKIKAVFLARILFRITRAIGYIPLSKLVFAKVHREFGNNIKVFISGGAKLDDEIIRDYRGLGILMLEGYGLTETAPMATYHPFDGQRIGTAGKVFDEIEIKFGDDGEIILRGPNVMQGYWNKPDDTAEVLKDGWFSTGDLGRIDKDRYLYITGRKKDIIVLPNGKNIRPDLIEEEIARRFDLVKEIAVTERQGQLFAVICPNMDKAREHKITNLSETIKWNIIDIYNQGAKSYNRIYDFFISNDELPRTRMGKLKRYMLSSFIENTNREKPKEKKPDYEEYQLIEKQIEFLTDRTPRASDHFEIDLGMDSLSIIEFQVFIEKTFGIALDQGWIGHYSTVETLADFVRAQKTTQKMHVFDWGKVLNEKTAYNPSHSDFMFRIFSSLFKIFFHRRIKISTKGLENLPSGACIIAPNHQSFLDSLILMHGIPGKIRSRIYFLAKEKNFRSPILRFFARHANIIIMDINRDLVHSLQKISAIIRDNNKVVIFPEGARSRDGKLAPFKKTFSIVAKELNVPVVPAVIRGAYDLMPINVKIPRKGKVSVEFLQPIEPQNNDAHSILESTRNMISIKCDR